MKNNNKMNNRTMPLTVALMIAAVMLTTGCDKGGRTLPSATGSIYECVVVTNNTSYSPIASVLAADMPCLPQMEPYFSLSHVEMSAFDDFLRSARNVLIADTDSARYTQVKARFSRDNWSKPQAVCRIQAPDTASFAAWWRTNGTAVREWFVREELARQGRFLRGSTNKQAREALRRKTGCDMLIPEDYMLVKDSANIVWCCNSKGPVRRDLVIYTYPYTDSLAFTLGQLCLKRDEVLGKLISGSVQGSYMGTEYRHFPPQMRYIAALEHSSAGSASSTSSTSHTSHTSPASSFYAAELRGLWRLYGGEAMGGPFVSHSVLDYVSGNIITAEVFVYAAGQKKRNSLRQAEAILYTLETPEKK